MAMSIMRCRCIPFVRFRKIFRVVNREFGISSREKIHNDSAKFIEIENSRFKHFFNPLEKQVSEIREVIFNDYLHVSEALESHQDVNMRDVSGSYEYFSYRKSNENYCNIYRRKIGSAQEEEKVINLDSLSQFYNQMLTLVEFKLSQCHSIAGVVVELCDTGRFAIVIKDIARNVCCEISLPDNAYHLGIEIVTTCPTLLSSGSVFLFISSSLDGVRPSQVFRLQCKPLDLFGRGGWTPTQRLRTLTPPPHAASLLINDFRPAYFVSMARSKDDKWLLFHHHSKNSSEVRAISVLHPAADPVTLKTARENEQVFVDHIPGFFYVAHRQGLNDLEIRKLPSSPADQELDNSLDDISSSEWVHLWPSPRDRAKGYFVEDYDIFHSHMVIYGRSSLSADLFLQLVRLDDGAVLAEHTGTSLAPLIGTLPTTLTPRANGNYRSKTACFALCSPILPEASFEIDLSSGKLLRTHIIASPLTSVTHPDGSVWFKYACERLHVSSEDSYEVPVLICGPRQVQCTSSRDDDMDVLGRVDSLTARPTILFAYGSYGVPIPTPYLSEVSIYMHRGWNVAFVCARGGGECGKRHHAAGSLMNKWNTFKDYKAAANYLIEAGYTTPSLLCGSGSSAGGLVIGVALNNYHQLFAAVLMRNPFLGIYNAVQSHDSPLVVHEYDEWGDTSLHNDIDGTNRAETVLQYIRSYSPCENIHCIESEEYSDHSFPAVYLTLGLCDDKVNPSDSMDWVKLLRTQLSLPGGKHSAPMKQDDNIVVRIQSQAGHDGPSTVEEQIEEAAMEITFLETVVVGNK